MTSYATTFPSTEDPISESGKWQDAHTVAGGAWTATVSAVGGTPGHAVGPNSSGTGDAVALLSGWTGGNDYTVTATVFNSDPGNTGAAEVELHTRGTLASNSVKTYEADWFPPNSIALARWNGANGDVTILVNITNTQGDPVDGAILSFSVSGTNPVVLTVKQDGVTIASFSDSDAARLQSGLPGHGYDAGTPTNGAKLGLKAWSVDDGVVASDGRPLFFRGGRPGMQHKLRRLAQIYPDITAFAPAPLEPVPATRGRISPRFGGPAARHRIAQLYPSTSANAYTLLASAGTYVLTGIAANLIDGDDLPANAGTFVLSGKSANLLKGYLLSGSKGTYSLTGIAANTLHGYVLTAGKGTFSLTGNVINLLVGRVVSATAGSYVETGIAATFEVGRVLSGSVGAFTLAGNAANLVYSGAVASPGVSQNPFLASPPHGMHRR